MPMVNTSKCIQFRARLLLLLAVDILVASTCNSSSMSEDNSNLLGSNRINMAFLRSMDLRNMVLHNMVLPNMGLRNMGLRNMALRNMGQAGLSLVNSKEGCGTLPTLRSILNILSNNNSNNNSNNINSSSSSSSKCMETLVLDVVVGLRRLVMVHRIDRVALKLCRLLIILTRMLQFLRIMAIITDMPLSCEHILKMGNRMVSFNM